MVAATVGAGPSTVSESCESAWLDTETAEARTPEINSKKTSDGYEVW